MTLSTLTIVRGRRENLRRQFRGLMESHQSPDRWVIVSMGEDLDLEECFASDLLASCPFEIRTRRIDVDGSDLPLAASRNMAASMADTDDLVFLDVDCIPDNDLLSRLQASLRQQSGLYMASIGYLPKNWEREAWLDGDDTIRFETLRSISQQHPLLPRVTEGETLRCDRYELFWSLCFAIRRHDFEDLGGFDDDMIGYGAEDTDLSFTARERKLPFFVHAAKAFHQFHPVCKPPLHNFDDIITNATCFRRKWRLWPMDKWLHQFDEMGLIDFDPDAETIGILRRPTDAEMKATRSESPAGY